MDCDVNYSNCLLFSCQRKISSTSNYSEWMIWVTNPKSNAFLFEKWHKIWKTRIIDSWNVDTINEIIRHPARLCPIHAIIKMNYLNFPKKSELLKNCWFLKSSFYVLTLCCISLDRCCFGLETRVIFKISTHPCYPMNVDWLGWFTIIFKSLHMVQSN